MDNVDCIVIGAGVIGLAVARQLASAERETSSRNSEVIHAGLYYETGSLKAGLCLTGRDMRYGYCEECNVPPLPLRQTDRGSIKRTTLKTGNKIDEAFFQMDSQSDF